MHLKVYIKCTFVCISHIKIKVFNKFNHIYYELAIRIKYIIIYGKKLIYIKYIYNIISVKMIKGNLIYWY